METKLTSDKINSNRWLVPTHLVKPVKLQETKLRTG